MSVCLYVIMSESLPVRVNELSKVLLGLISCPSSQLEKNVLDFKESLGSLSSSGKLIELYLIKWNELCVVSVVVCG